MIVRIIAGVVLLCGMAALVAIVVTMRSSDASTLAPPAAVDGKDHDAAPMPRLATPDPAMPERTALAQVPSTPAAPAAIPDEVQAQVALHSAAAASEPPELAGFHGSDMETQAGLLAPMQGRVDLPVAVVSYLQIQLRIRDNHPTTRNLIANLLGAQERQLAGYLEDLVRMADDVQESVLWRDYAIQQTAAIAHADPSGVRGNQVIGELQRWMATGEGSQRGTAAITLWRLVQAGMAVMPPAAPTLLADLARDGRADPRSRMAAVQVLVESRDVGAPAVLRGIGLDGDDPGLRRTVIWGLGEMGNADDVEIVRRAAVIDDPELVETARLAEEALLKRHRAE